MSVKTCLKIEMAGADIITIQRKAVTFHEHGKYDKHIPGIVKVGGRGADPSRSLSQNLNYWRFFALMLKYWPDFSLLLFFRGLMPRPGQDH